MSIITCHSGEYDSPEIIHMTVEECNASALPGESCRTPYEHHKPVSRVDLERGKWLYVGLTDALHENKDTVLFVTTKLTEAIREARLHSGWRRKYTDRVGGPSGRYPRKGAAYGLLIEGDTITVTIVPTPRNIP